MIKFMETPLVSIIVPIYNVAKFLPACLDSILAQSYKQLEIILVNDGSPDESPTICNDYAARDERVVVVNQENKGLPGARSTGVAVAKGGHLLFVDGDDQIDSRLVEYLLQAKQSADAQIACCTFKRFTGDTSPIEGSESTPRTETYHTAEALCQLMYQKHIIPAQWGKLYDKELFDDLDFPGHNYDEDFAMTYRLVAKTRRVVVLPEYAGCFYRYDTASMSNDGSRLAEKVEIGMSIAATELEFARTLAKNQPDAYHSVIAAAEYRCFAEAVFLAIKIPDGEHKEVWNALAATINQYKHTVLLDRAAPTAGRKRALIATLAGAGTLRRMLRRKVNAKLDELTA